MFVLEELMNVQSLHFHKSLSGLGVSHPAQTTRPGLLLSVQYRHSHGSSVFCLASKTSLTAREGLCDEMALCGRSVPLADNVAEDHSPTGAVARVLVLNGGLLKLELLDQLLDAVKDPAVWGRPSSP
mmetsp:Transcript_150422/g.262831  ORF Transcript_150422/g.262831 Transcript_150422/m.262831 type:complete len:127 (+) Transcript_150422:2088-2468(+)